MTSKGREPEAFWHHYGGIHYKVYRRGKRWQVRWFEKGNPVPRRVSLKATSRPEAEGALERMLGLGERPPEPSLDSHGPQGR